LQARLTSALLLPLSPVLKWHGQYQGLGTIPAVTGCPSPLGYDPQVPPYASKTLPSRSGITSMSHHARLRSSHDNIGPWQKANGGYFRRHNYCV
jgi:hypothetical protein